MSARPPRIPPRLINPSIASAIRPGRLVRGSLQWRDMVDAGNWLLSKGSSLVVGGPPGAGAIAPGDAVTLSYYLWPHERNFARLWCLSLMSSRGALQDRSDGLTGAISIGDGGAQPWSIPAGYRTYQPLPFRFAQFVDPPSGDAGPVDLVVSNDADSLSDLLIAGVCCYEVPRSVLSDLPDEVSCNSRAPIYADAADLQSIHAASISAYEAITDARRAKLFDFWSVAGVLPADNTAYTDVGNVFVADPFVMARHLQVAGNGTPIITRRVAVAVKAAVLDTGDVRLTVRAGMETAEHEILHFDSATPTWKVGDLSIVTEDVANLATNAGIRSGEREPLTVEAISPVAGQIAVYGIAVGEFE